MMNEASGSTLPNYPFLDKHEFRLICEGFAASFEERDTDPGDWQKVQCKILDDQCCLRISRVTTEQANSFAESRSNEGRSCDEMLEEIDEEALPRHINPDSQQHGFEIQYDILLSPSYSVPVMYLSVRDDNGQVVTENETIHLLLVPEVYRSQIRHVGVMGGLSMANHPMTDIPAFFIHPCQTADALREVAWGRAVSPEDYLFLWMGIVGGSVGLSAPSSLRVQKT